MKFEYIDLARLYPDGHAEVIDLFDLLDADRDALLALAGATKIEDLVMVYATEEHEELYAYSQMPDYKGAELYKTEYHGKEFFLGDIVVMEFQGGEKGFYTQAGGPIGVYMHRETLKRLESL